MIDITPQAERYFENLLGAQDEEGLGLRIQVLNPGTPRADCELTFCAPEEAKTEDEVQSCSSFQLFIDANSGDWLNEAKIDFEPNETGGQLTIKAPNIKGRAPDENAPLADRVAWVLDTEINPQVASHGGHVQLHQVTEDGRALLQFGGGCQGCGMVNVTLKNGVEKTLKEKVPELTEVLDVTDHGSGENPYYK